jgi:CDP-diacylglycerol--glycerol-3-phosphate 3-phosphatidyltransferase
MTVILILRDTLVDFLRMVLASRQITLSAGIYGKLKTLFQMIGLTLLFFISHLNFSEQETILANEYG